MPDVIDLTIPTNPRNAAFNPRSDLSIAQRPLKRPRTDDGRDCTIIGHTRPPPIVISDSSNRKRPKDSQGPGKSRQGSRASSRSQSARGTRPPTPSTSHPAPAAPNRVIQTVYVISSDSDEDDEVAQIVRGVRLYAQPS